MIWALFGSTVLNYFSGQVLSGLALLFTKELHLGVSRIFVDIVGSRLGLSIAVVWWSLVSLGTSFSKSVFSVAKSVAESFLSQEGRLAVAIFHGGSSIGGPVAALAMPWIALPFGSRACVPLLWGARLRLGDCTGRPLTDPVSWFYVPWLRQLFK